MAEVDFTNARIEPFSGLSGLPNPTSKSYLGLDTNNLYDVVNYTTEVGVGTRTRVKDAQKSFVNLYSGTFNTSGTQFGVWALGGTLTGWKVSNITFSAGDTYVFSIKADLICQ